MGRGWQRYHLRAVVDDGQQKWLVTRKMTAAMDKGGCWHLTLVMDGRMTTAFDGGGDRQQQGGVETTVQCRRWVVTRQWMVAMAASDGQQRWWRQWTMEMVLDNGSGKWTFEVVSTRVTAMETAMTMMKAMQSWLGNLFGIQRNSAINPIPDVLNS
jgi:hypothetical protein